ncbi:ABC transporter ATP-binding protein [Traorella massiliensis]|uniref:ABC transporter ATP-binding protein n=1 Tax=Traorella massiliensis TaxID=1903263 RepID=UPI0008F933B7|nr:ABC transporter ATP-binding protein [Traorella massiliensis]
MNILETKDLYFTYPDGDARKVILNDVNVSFEKGKFYTILGASGSGKTTFLSFIAALDKPEKGEILYEGKSLSEIGYEKYRRNNAGIVFQSYNLIPYMNAVENVMVAMSITDNEMEKDMKGQALRILESVGIDGSKATRRINRLSGGEQQRVAIARAISTNVEVVLADEPTGNLDAKTSETIIEIFKELAHKQNKCVIMVTHSEKIANQSDVILKLNTDNQNFEITGKE